MNGRAQGEIQKASNRTFSDPLNSMRQAGLSIRVDNPLADYIMENDALLKVYRKPKRGGSYTLLLVGDIIQAEESGDGNMSTINVLAADPFWRLMKRLIGLAVNANGQGTGLQGGSVTQEADLSAMLALFLGALNGTNAASHTGVNPGVITPSINTVLGPLYATFIGQMIQDSCNTLGGPDFQINPLEPSGTMPNTIIATMDFLTRRGATRNVTFEYGTGKRNVQTYDRLKSKQNVANWVGALPQGWPTSIANGDRLVYSFDLGSIETISQLDDIAGADVASIPLRQALTDEHVAVRKDMQQQITFSPKINCSYEYPTDYSTGDIVTARAWANGSYRYNGQARVYGVSVTIDDNDGETVALTLIPGTE